MNSTILKFIPVKWIISKCNPYIKRKWQDFRMEHNICELINEIQLPENNIALPKFPTVKTLSDEYKIKYNRYTNKTEISMLLCKLIRKGKVKEMNPIIGKCNSNYYIVR
jgi:hypothetical protein